MRTAIVLAAAVGVGGCGSGDPGLVVFGASSLQPAFDRYDAGFPGAPVRASYAGSDQLAVQIEQGAHPDVFASADLEWPRRLHREGFVSRPVVFAANRLVLAVPKDSSITSLAGVEKRGVKLVIGDRSVPVGAYTREVLSRLPRSRRGAILANVRSEEPELSSVVAKLAGGAADAGFVYATDVRAAATRLRAIPLPAHLQPRVSYGAAVVNGASDPGEARRYVSGLLRGAGARDLRATGFLPPP
jgi:molybdate transport system substrate-binding protein